MTIVRLVAVGLVASPLGAIATAAAVGLPEPAARRGRPSCDGGTVTVYHTGRVRQYPQSDSSEGPAC